MALCTTCGAVIHPEDVKKHVCAPANIPQKGKELQPQNIAVDVA